jgi:hypothetical protein
MRKLLALLTIVFLSLQASAQYGVYAGLTGIKAFGIQGVFPGMNFGVEIPTRDEVTFYLRASFTLKNKYNDSLNAEAISGTTSPQIIYVPTVFGSGMFNIEGGNRYYIGNGFDDYGFSAYGGTVYQLYTMGVSRKSTVEFDETLYTIKDGATAVDLAKRGRILALGIGLNGGMQYNVGTTVFYFDCSATYNVFAFPSNYLASQYNSYSPINLSFNLGVRKTFF